MPKVPDVMLSIDTCGRSEYERGLLRMLERGEREIAAGVGFELARVLHEADAILAGDRRPGKNASSTRKGG